jgi:hypothetical protein
MKESLNIGRNKPTTGFKSCSNGIKTQWYAIAICGQASSVSYTISQNRNPKLESPIQNPNFGPTPHSMITGVIPKCGGGNLPVPDDNLNEPTTAPIRSC